MERIKVRYNIMAYPDIINDTDLLAEYSGLSRSQIIQIALERYLKEYSYRLKQAKCEKYEEISGQIKLGEGE